MTQWQYTLPQVYSQLEMSLLRVYKLFEVDLHQKFGHDLLFCVPGSVQVHLLHDLINFQNIVNYKTLVNLNKLKLYTLMNNIKEM